MQCDVIRFKTLISSYMDDILLRTNQDFLAVSMRSRLCAKFHAGTASAKYEFLDLANMDFSARTTNNIRLKIRL